MKKPNYWKVNTKAQRLQEFYRKFTHLNLKKFAWANRPSAYTPCHFDERSEEKSLRPYIQNTLSLAKEPPQGEFLPATTYLQEI
jgi:hypothetical protein